MGIFKPTVLRRRVQELSPGLLRELGVRAVLLDVDNTIAPYGVRRPVAGAAQWARGLTQEGFRVVIVSNNYKKRVSSFAAQLGLPCISFALKPLPFGYVRAAKMLGLRCRDCAIIGDQIFTDILCGRLAGCTSILVEYMEEEGYGFYVTKRRWEKRVLKHYRPRQWQPDPRMEGWD